jgi:hypothetical protein
MGRRSHRADLYLGSTSVFLLCHRSDQDFTGDEPSRTGAEPTEHTEHTEGFFPEGTERREGGSRTVGVSVGYGLLAVRL